MDQAFTMSDRDAFDESFYLEIYPDIAKAIADGGEISAWDHYDRHGRREGRLGTRFEPDFYLRSYRWRSSKSTMTEPTRRWTTTCASAAPGVGFRTPGAPRAWATPQPCDHRSAAYGRTSRMRWTSSMAGGKSANSQSGRPPCCAPGCAMAMSCWKTRSRKALCIRR